LQKPDVSVSRFYLLLLSLSLLEVNL